MDGISIKDWIYTNIIPRPRDLIHFIQRSIEWAINRGHSEIMDTDLKSALDNYSGFALEQIIAEYKAEEQWLAMTLRSFMGSNSVISLLELTKHLEKSNLGQLARPDIPYMVTTLIKIGFFGVKLNGNEIGFAKNLQKAITLVSLVKSQYDNKSLYFIIHPVYRRHLQICEKKIPNTTPYKLILERDIIVNESNSNESILLKILKKILGT